MKTSSFTNIDDEEFQGMFDGNPYFVEAGKSEAYPLPLAEFLAAQLASKILSKAGVIPSSNVPLYNEKVARILGRNTVDFASLTYAELKEMAKEKKIAITKENGKLATKEELALALSK